MQQWHLSRLPYEYQDGILDAAAVHALFDSADPLARFATDEKLFASLAAKSEFTDLMRQSVARVNKWLSDAKRA